METTAKRHARTTSNVLINCMMNDIIYIYIFIYRKNKIGKGHDVVILSEPKKRLL
jgi:hypothetical protein